MGTMGGIGMSRNVWSAERRGIGHRTLGPSGVERILRPWGLRWLRWWLRLVLPRSLGLRIGPCMAGAELLAVSGRTALGSARGEIRPRRPATEVVLGIAAGEVGLRARQSVVGPWIRAGGIGTRAKEPVVGPRTGSREVRARASERVIRPRISASEVWPRAREPVVDPRIRRREIGTRAGERIVGARAGNPVAGPRIRRREIGAGTGERIVGPRIRSRRIGARVWKWVVGTRASERVVGPRIGARAIRPRILAPHVTPRTLVSEVRPWSRSGVTSLGAASAEIGPRIVACVAGLRLTSGVSGPRNARHALRGRLVEGTLGVGFSLRTWALRILALLRWPLLRRPWLRWLLRPVRHTAGPLGSVSGLRAVRRTKGGGWRLRVVRGQRRLRGEGGRQRQEIVGTQGWTGAEGVVGMRGGFKRRWCSRRAWQGGRATMWWWCSCCLLPARRHGSVLPGVVLAWVVLACIAQLCIPRLRSALSGITSADCILPSITIASLTLVRVTIARLPSWNLITWLTPARLHISRRIPPEIAPALPAQLKSVAAQALLIRVARVRPRWMWINPSGPAGTAAVMRRKWSSWITTARLMLSRSPVIWPIWTQTSMIEADILYVGDPHVEPDDVQRARVKLSCGRGAIYGFVSGRVAQTYVVEGYVTQLRVAHTRTRRTRVVPVQTGVVSSVALACGWESRKRVRVRRSGGWEFRLALARFLVGRNRRMARLRLSQLWRAARVLLIQFLLARLGRVPLSLFLQTARVPLIQFLLARLGRLPLGQSPRITRVLLARLPLRSAGSLTLLVARLLLGQFRLAWLARLPQVGVARPCVALGGVLGPRARGTLGRRQAPVAQGTAMPFGIAAARPVHPPAPAFRARPPPRALGFSRPVRRRAIALPRTPPLIPGLATPGCGTRPHSARPSWTAHVTGSVSSVTPTIRHRPP